MAEKKLANKVFGMFFDRHALLDAVNAPEVCGMNRNHLDPSRAITPFERRYRHQFCQNTLLTGQAFCGPQKAPQKSFRTAGALNSDYTAFHPGAVFLLMLFPIAKYRSAGALSPLSTRPQKRAPLRKSPPTSPSPIHTCTPAAG